MNPQVPQGNSASLAGCLGMIVSVVIAVVIAWVLIASYASSHQHVVVTTCTMMACTQTTLPVQP